MSNAHECPPVEQLQQLALGQLSNPPASSVEQHVLDCDPCAQATLNLAKDETLIGAMRGAAAKAKPVGSEPLAAGVTLDGDSAALSERVSLLIQKLRDLPTHASDADSATVLFVTLIEPSTVVATRAFVLSCARMLRAMKGHASRANIRPVAFHRAMDAISRV